MAAKKPKKATKKGLGAKKPKKPIKSPRSGRTAKAKAMPKKKAKPKREKPAPRDGGRSRIAFICSECYEDFTFSGGDINETVTCPECLHVGKKPDDDFLRTVSMHKSGEKSSLVLACLVLTALLGASGAAIYFISPHFFAGGDGDTNTTMIAGIAAAFIFLISLLLVARYEKNRWEIYF